MSDAYTVRMSKHKDFMHVRARAKLWGDALGVPLAWYSHPRSAAPILRTSGTEFQTSGTHLPELSSVVRAVFGLSDVYPVLSRPDNSGSDASDCNQFKGSQIDPNVIASTYHNTPPPENGRRPGFGKHAQGIAAFEDAQFFQSDVSKFQHDYNLSSINITIIGPNNGGYYGEAGLDTQYIFSTGSGVATSFIALKGFDLLKWSWKVMNLTSPPAVLSVSWGNGESNFDVQHMHAANIEFAKMGLKGHTVLTASGDDGTGGQGGLFSPCKRFDPTWPTSSPYVTSVGGTYLDSTNGGTEIGWSFSGGGFSAVFERPSYQNEAVGAYVKDATLPPASLFNASGRATPDVSALSTNFKTLAKGAYGCLSGTSAATPVFAGMISLLNDEQVAVGKPTLGFINPMLYRGSGAIGFDVVEGNNKHQFCKAGFSAGKGYDAVTGWGTPEMQQLRQVLVGG